MAVGSGAGFTVEDSAVGFMAFMAAALVLGTSAMQDSLRIVASGMRPSRIPARAASGCIRISVITRR